MMCVQARSLRASVRARRVMASRCGPTCERPRIDCTRFCVRTLFNPAHLSADEMWTEALPVGASTRLVARLVEEPAT